ncbi:unnamed protein product, partial [Meganyctiphanes norvegica]
MPSSISQAQPVSRRSPRSISNVERAAICRYQQRHPSVSSASVVAWAQDELGVNVSRNTVSRVLKKAAHDRMLSTQILNNILDDYTKTVVGHTAARQQNIQDMDKSTDVATDAMVGHVHTVNEVSPGDVQKYLQAWISHLRATGHAEEDHLVRIAEKHLQILETSILNSKIQTTINKYFRQSTIYNNSSGLINHHRTQIGNMPFQCNQCDKVFKHRKHLVIHLRIHTGEKPFHCNQCNKAFTQKGNLVT